MSLMDLQRIMEEVRKLSADERRQLQGFLDAPTPPSEDALLHKLREAGLLRHPPRRPSASRRVRPPLIRVTGKPVSETLIEERR